MTNHVAEHRAKYHPTVPIEATVSHTATGKRVRIVANMCEVHAKLWGSLSQPQQDAANHISRCWHVVHGSPAKAVDLSRLIEPRGGEMSAEREQHFRAEYFAWQSDCLMDGVDYNVAVLVCGEGAAISAITKNRTRQKQMTEQLRLSLDVMAAMKGWR